MSVLALILDHLGAISQFITTLVVAFSYIQSRRNGTDIREVKHATNSLMDRLVETTRIEAHAAGIKEQKDREP